MRNLIGYVQQEPVLFNKSIKENLIFGREELVKEIAKHEGLTVDELIDQACEESFAKDFITKLPESYEYKVGIKGSKLSGGQKQRVAIARALALNPNILLCDEATSALDPNTTKSILALLRDINEKLGITIIIVTHQMEVVKEICQRVAIMEGGQVIAVGKTEDLFLKNSKALKTLIGEEEILPNEGINIRLFFPKDNSNDSIITAMARELDIDFSIVWGKLERFRDDVLGSLVINIKENQKDEVVKYLTSKNMPWEVI